MNKPKRFTKRTNKRTNKRKNKRTQQNRKRTKKNTKRFRNKNSNGGMRTYTEDGDITEDPKTLLDGKEFFRKMTQIGIITKDRKKYVNY